MKKLLLFSSLLILLIGCETGYKGETNSSTNENIADENTPLSYNPKPEQSYIPAESFDEDFTGGIESEGLDIGTIRVNEHGESIRLVFDSYQWNQTTEYLGEKVEKVGSYDFVYNADKLLINATVHGYRGFSAQLPKFSKDSIVEDIYFDEYLDDSGYKFVIKLRYDAKVKVFDLQNPGRIVVDIGSL